MSQGFYKPDWPLTIKAIGKLLWICKNLGTIIPMKPFWKKMLDNKIQKTSKWSKTKIMVRKEKVICNDYIWQCKCSTVFKKLSNFRKYQYVNINWLFECQVFNLKKKLNEKEEST